MGWQRELVPRRRLHELLLVRMKTPTTRPALSLPEYVCQEQTAGCWRAVEGSGPFLVAAAWWLDWYQGKGDGRRKEVWGETLTVHFILGIFDIPKPLGWP